MSDMTRARTFPPPAPPPRRPAQLERSALKMKLLAIAWLSLASTAFAQSSVHFEKIVRYREVVSGQVNEVAIHQRPFDFSGCKLTGGENTGEVAKIDGV